MHEELRSSFENFCKKHLNEHQRDVVERVEGTMVVHAGAGSGKTRIITARITSLLLNSGVPARSLLALTFTNKAAREMKERVLQFLGFTGEVPFVGTFHSYCVKFLRMHKKFLPIPEFTILDDDDQEKIVKGILAQNSLTKRMTPRQLMSTISRIKNNSALGAIDYEAINDTLIRELCVLYEKEKSASQCYDFDDLLLMSLKLFKTEPSIKQEHHRFVRHVLVDEYQDTNSVQHALIREMSLSDDKKCLSLDSLCVVGDEDQSIYSWRGAVAGTMITFKNDFPWATSLTLDQNYRSAQPILDVANHLIKQNSQRKTKNLWSEKEGSDRVRLLTCVSGTQEGNVIAELCKLYKAKEIPLRNIAAFYRSHYQSRALEEALIKQSIPYIIVGGTQFYNRQEIKDVLGYLKLVVNPFDRVSWARVINTPARGLGDKFQEQFLACWDENPFLNFKEVSALVIERGLVSGIKQESLERFLGIFSHLTTDALPADALDYLSTAIKYSTYLQEAYEKNEAQERLENVKELLQAARSRQELGVRSIGELLEEIALLQEHKSASEDHNCISLMTLHAAKGLEFDTVIITGVEEGILPSGHSLLNSEAIEEERRLFYVGITRAQAYLLITNARFRSTYGQRTDQRPSRFLKELTNMGQISQQDVSIWGAFTMAQYFKQWLGSPVRTWSI